MENKPKVSNSKSPKIESIHIGSLQVEEVGQPGDEGFGIIRVVEQPEIGLRRDEHQCPED